MCQHRFGFLAQPFVIVSARPFRIHISTSPTQSFAKESKAVLTHRTPKALPVNARLVRTSRVGTASGSGLRTRRFGDGADEVTELRGEEIIRERRRPDPVVAGDGCG